jgi:GT2 family glycosyltransferase
LTAEIVLPTAASPRVSIIILAWRHDHHLWRCLEAITEAGSAIPFEVIILLNGATPAVTAVVDRTEGARVIRSPVNLGFAAGCNRARAAARGELLLLLNDDTEVEPGWMEALVRTVDDSGAAAVGSRVLFADGTLQEAGCIIWRDGGTATVGRGSRDEDGCYDYLRPVHYCSACSLLVRAAAWDAVGGFDEGYFPGYFEDADFCLRLRQEGLTVLYQPAARVRHHESASLESSYKAFVLRRSRTRFSDRWRHVLPRFPHPEAPDALERAVQLARGPRRALLVGERCGDAARELSRSGWAVTVHAAHIEEDHRSLAAAGVEHVREDLGRHLRAPSRAYDAVIVAGVEPFEAWAPLIRAAQPATTLMSDLRGSGARGSLAVTADGIVTASEADAGALRARNAGARVWVGTGPPSWDAVLDGTRRHRYRLS